MIGFTCNRFIYQCLLLVILPLSGCAAIKSLFFGPAPFVHEHPHTPLQNGLLKIVEELDLQDAVTEKRIGVALVDITDIQNPQVAGINELHMMYAASLPKICILLGLFKRLEDNTLQWDEPTIKLAREMMEVSSNEAATTLFYLVGPDYIRKLILKYNLYNPRYGGGLWIGKEYGKGEALEREPLMNLAHAATASAVVQFYYLLESGKLLTPIWANRMRDLMSHSKLDHKFIKGYRRCCPRAQLIRKSGSWRNFHSDSAIVYTGNRRYIVAALINDPKGDRWLEQLPSKLNRLIHSTKIAIPQPKLISDRSTQDKAMNLFSY